MKMIHATRPGLILGFHGCEEKVRNGIINGEIKMIASRKPYDWLGNGYYFWENSYERAYDFACHPPGNKIIQSPSVLGAVIDLQFCLDLLDKANLDLLHESFVSLCNVTYDNGEEMPVNKFVKGSADLLLRNLDYAVIEYLHQSRIDEQLRPFDSVRSVFIEGEELYPGAGFKNKNHIQICIRNPNCIIGYFNPIDTMRWADVKDQRYSPSTYLEDTGN